MIDADTFIREIKTLFTPALADSWRYGNFAAISYGDIYGSHGYESSENGNA